MSERTSSRVMMGTLVFLICGPILWALHLTLIYGGQSALCAMAAVEAPVVSGWVIGISVVLVAFGVVGLVFPGSPYRWLATQRERSDQWPFLVCVMRSLTALSLLAMCYAALGATLLPPCGGLR